jgi:chemotaxis protein histidine kinase CheA
MKTATRITIADISGATITGDGKVHMILDVPFLHP